MAGRLLTGGIVAGILVAGVFAAREANLAGPARAPLFRQKGPAAARVVIVEFSDFQCPNCAKGQAALKELMSRHGGEVLMAFRHYPLTKMHKWAYPAARAAEGAGAQGKFWEYHDLLFERQAEWAKSENPEPFFFQYAEFLQLDIDRFKRDYAGRRWDSSIERDMRDAKSLNVSATPTFFINKRRLVGETQLREYGERYVELEKNK